ncbi:MAG: Gfo/Idh/MocA family oxidoreductase [Propioniciclava sp.]|uniref:Gfo/Idh/MocA family protein n=1 Tax=Propioniciclava sp. TaxID=2038686 RepID=UPI0039E65B27
MGGLRWGILGLGGIAHAFAHDVNAVGSTLQAVGSRAQDKADAFATQYGAARGYARYEDLAADPDVDAIYIATPHPWHAANAELALRAGKHVLIEKPLALNADQARRVRDLARETGLFAMEAMRTRWMPHTVRIRELIAGGALGTVRSLVADHSQLLDPDPGKRLRNPGLGGGALLDLGIYNLAFASDLFGDPATVTASARMTDTGVDAETSMLLSYAGGVQALLHTALDLRGPNTAIILGTQARIEVAASFYASSKFRLIDPHDRILEDFDQPYAHHGKEFEIWEVERCVAAGLTESPRMALDETVRIHETMDAIRAQIGLRYPQE